LVPIKSYWGLLGHSWNPSSAKWNLRLIANTPDSIYIRKVDSDEQEALRCIKPGKAVKTLGVMLNMAGADKAEAAYLWNKAEVWAEQIWTG
jgi:hypothetical protein